MSEPTQEQIKFRIGCPICLRAFGFEEADVKGVYRCKYCRSEFPKDEIEIKEKSNE